MARRVRVIAIAPVALLVAAVLTATAGAQPPTLKEFDHYLCYKVTGAKIKPPPVTLIDQFDQAENTTENAQPKRANQLCAPLFEKNHEQVLVDPVIHLLRYPFTATAKAKTLELVNQFETVVLKTVNAVELLVPSTKNLEAPPPPPTGEEPSYEHYKCYTLAKTKFTRKEVVVTDQFGAHTLVLTSRKHLCNPVTKIVAEREFPIRRPERHLLCYAVKSPVEPQRTVYTNDQFGPEKLILKSTTTAGPAMELCLPSIQYNPQLSVEKLQRITGGFTTTPTNGEVGDTVDYEIVVRNTGNVPLTYQASDANCNNNWGTGSVAPGGVVTLTCSHVLSPTSSSAFPGLGRCVNAPGGTGRYASPSCNTPEVSNGDYEWLPGAAQNKFTATLSPTELTGTGGEHLACAGGTDEGEYIDESEDLETITLTGCELVFGSGGSVVCPNEGSEPPGTIKTAQLRSRYGFIKRPNEAGVSIEAASSPYVIYLPFTCSTIRVAVQGSAISRIAAVGAMTPSFTESFESTGNVQEPENFEAAVVGSYSNTAIVTGTPPVGEGRPVTVTSNTVVVNVVTDASRRVLETSFGNPFEYSALKTTGTITNEEPLEIRQAP